MRKPQYSFTSLSYRRNRSLCRWISCRIAENASASTLDTSTQEQLGQVQVSAPSNSLHNRQGFTQLVQLATWVFCLILENFCFQWSAMFWLRVLSSVPRYISPDWCGQLNNATYSKHTQQLDGMDTVWHSEFRAIWHVQ